MTRPQDHGLGQFSGVDSGGPVGVQRQDIGIWSLRTYASLGDQPPPGVEGPSRHHRRPPRRPLPARGGSCLWRLPGLDQPPRRSLSGMRASWPSSPAPGDPSAHPWRSPGDRRAHPPSPPGTQRPRPRRRPRDHRLAPRTPSPSARLAGHRQPLPDASWPRPARPDQASEDLLHPLPSPPPQPVLAGRLHPLRTDTTQRQVGTRHRDPDLARRLLPLRPTRYRSPRRHRPPRGRQLPTRGRSLWRSQFDPDR